MQRRLEHRVRQRCRRKDAKSSAAGVVTPRVRGAWGTKRTTLLSAYLPSLRSHSSETERKTLVNATCGTCGSPAPERMSLRAPDPSSSASPGGRRPASRASCACWASGLSIVARPSRPDLDGPSVRAGDFRVSCTRIAAVRRLAVIVLPQESFRCRNSSGVLAGLGIL